MVNKVVQFSCSAAFSVFGLLPRCCFSCDIKQVLKHNSSEKQEKGLAVCVQG